MNLTSAVDSATSSNTTETNTSGRGGSWTFAFYDSLINATTTGSATITTTTSTATVTNNPPQKMQVLKLMQS
jgi:hypothetical protein